MSGILFLSKKTGGAITNKQSRETGCIGHKTHTEYKQNKTKLNTEN
jgi:hypothetical protein